MRKEFLIAAGFLLGILLVYMTLHSTPLSASPYDTHKVHTLSGMDEVQKLIASGKKVYILYHASWCGHCKTLKPMFESVNDDFDDAVLAHCECAKHHDVPQKMGIEAFPCIRKYENGKQQAEMMGSRKDVNAVRQAMKEL